eukprot:TRINITY_DN29671_c0_g2_i1.p1 TRINITY_DN29671_c0_g2~~TRINITY_DN29671_c0_g2_i1.p1  ORF type:complete len:421 (-),score=62.70 TRINITY_DN29671_c0_g2_i1:363-1493(-)
MLVRCNGEFNPDLLGIQFNQNCSCLALATMQGIMVYNLDMEAISYQEHIGAIGILSMLYDSAYLWYVGAGEQATLSPRKLVVIDGSRQGGIVAEKFCETAILNVLLTKKWMVIVLEESVRILRLKSMIETNIMQTPPNIQGVAALSSNDLLAVPSSNEKGVIRVYNLNQSANLLCEIHAHNHPLSVLCWNGDGSLLGSASERGTVIRVYKMPTPEKCSFSFRAGIQKTKICSLAFSPAEVMPPLLCATTARGQIQLFRLLDATAKRVQRGFTKWIPLAVHGIVDVELPWLTLKLPGEESRLPTTSAIFSYKEQRSSITEGEISDDEYQEDKYREPIKVAVATAKGDLHIFHIHDVRSVKGPQLIEKRSLSILQAAS